MREAALTNEAKHFSKKETWGSGSMCFLFSVYQVSSSRIFPTEISAAGMGRGSGGAGYCPGGSSMMGVWGRGESECSRVGGKGMNSTPFLFGVRGASNAPGITGEGGSEGSPMSTGAGDGAGSGAVS